MVARFTGASLGLLAFAITAVAGLYVRNPIEVTLSRSILALFLFFFVGLLLGGVAQWVVREHEKERQMEIRNRYEAEAAGKDDGTAEDGALEGQVTSSQP